MWTARGGLGAWLFHPFALAVLSALAGWFALASAARAGAYEDPNTAEGWAWPQIARNEMPDFNERCGTPALDPMEENDARWFDDCRKLSAEFLQDLLTRAPWREAIPVAGIQIKGAGIVGKLDLDSAKLVRTLSILASRIEDDINLSHVRTDGLIWLEGSLMNGVFNAESLHSESDLYLREGTVFKSEVKLANAKIDGNVELTGARLDGKLTANQLRVGGYLLLNSSDQNKALFNAVDLTDARVAGQLSFLGATFNGPLIANLLKVDGNLLAPSVGPYKTSFRQVSLIGAEVAGQVSLIGNSFGGSLDAGLLQVGGSLVMNSDGQNKATFKRVDLTGAKITGNLSMQGARFEGALDAGLLQVGGTLSMSSVPTNLTSFAADVNLTGAKITGTFNADATILAGKLNADSLRVGGDLFMRAACHADTDVLVFAQIGGNLDLTAASLADADFSGAAVAGELRLDGGRNPGCTRTSARSDVLNVRNAKVGNLVVADDALHGVRRLRLDGFSFSRIGGGEADTKAQLRGRSAKWWDDWARLDPSYSPTPYAQLAAAFTSAGDRDAADDVRYLDRERERDVLCQQSWLRGSCLLQTALGVVAGYGIGSHTFVVLYWVLGFWLAGVALLWWTVPAARHNGAIWCCFASLAQLLPVITINKELTAFFDDPERKRLKGWQVFTFSALGLVGLALGTLLLIAVSGLTRIS